jgi:hypothetical protein
VAVFVVSKGFDVHVQAPELFHRFISLLGESVNDCFVLHSTYLFREGEGDLPLYFLAGRLGGGSVLGG